MLNMDTENSNQQPIFDLNVLVRSCEEEICEPLQGKITGTIPIWLSGCLIRNGSGSFKVGNDTFKHLFDGSALLHRFAIENGEATYQCRFLQSESYKQNQKANRIVNNGFVTQAVPDPCLTIFRKVSSIFQPERNQSDNALVSVYPIGDEIYAFTDTPVIYRINKTSLATETKQDIRKSLAIVHHTAHPHVTTDGSVFNLALSLTPTGLFYSIVQFPPEKSSFYNNNSLFKDAKKNVESNRKPKEKSRFRKAKIVARMPVKSLHPSYMHSFGLTENYYIIIEQPLSLSVPSAYVTLVKNKPLIGCMEWNENKQTQFNVLSRKTGKLVKVFYSDAFCYFHTINQYEVEGHIVLDIVCYKDASIIECFYTEALKNANNLDYAKLLKTRPKRFVLPMSNKLGKVHATPDENLVKISKTNAKAYKLANGKIFLEPELLCDIGCETPTINYNNFLGKHYRFFYGTSTFGDNETVPSIIKVDTYSKTSLQWSQKNCYPSEPVFIPKPDAQDEDDGVLLSAILWGQNDTNRVALIILDAKSLTEIGRAEFKTSSPVPKCYHGWFFPQNY